jgi:hypothetical protein
MLSLLKIIILLLPTLAIAAPNNPSDLKLKALSSSTVSIKWRDNSNNETGFKIFRDGELIQTVGENITEYIDEGLKANTTYRYTIKATDNSVDEPSLSGVHINEILAGNMNSIYDNDFYEYSDYIELKNYNSSSIDLGGYTISDDKKSWRIPDGTTISAKGYLLIWADKEDKKLNSLHTNFKISQKKEKITFKDRDGNTIDSISFKKVKEGVSIREVNGEIAYMEPSPLKDNSAMYASQAILSEAVFSQDGGFYSATQYVTLSSDEGGDIYYTIDGSIPTKNSPKYTTSIKVSKTTSIRARVYKEGNLPSKVVNKTFFINEDISLPVISLTVNKEYFYDDKTGIYKNYKEDWIRAAGIEYYKDKEIQFSENIGVRIFGHYTRNYAQKSLAIFAKSQFGAKSIKYPLFSEKPTMEKIDSFVLRNSGNDWGFTMLKDAFAQRVVKDNMDIDYQAYQPTIVFLNGEYWGLYNIREKINEDYFKANYGISDDDLDLLEGKYHVKAGSDKEYLKLVDYLDNHSLSNSDSYNFVASKIDIDEYINYMITEIYGGNDDWPYTNIKYWRDTKNDTPWRWVLYDMDFTYVSSRVDENSFEYALASNGSTTNPPWSTLLFRKLMGNGYFKKLFMTRFITHLNTTFKPARLDAILDELKSKIEPEVDRHFARWGRRTDNAWDGDGWGSIGSIRKFYDNRVGYVSDQIRNYLGANGSGSIAVKVPINGYISIDGVKLTNDYSADYFNGANVTLEAVAAEGYHFVRWSNGVTDAKINVILEDSVAIEAIFE